MINPETAFKDFHAALRRYIARRLDNQDDVDDVVQDVFLRVTRNRTALGSTKEPLAWLYSVAKSALIDHYRRKSKHAIVDSGALPIDVPNPPADVASGDFSACLLPLLDSLPEKYRDALKFIDMEGGRQVDFALNKGLPLSTVKSHVQRGRRQLSSAILACCLVERDGLRNVTHLARGKCKINCCED